MRAVDCSWCIALLLVALAGCGGNESPPPGAADGGVAGAAVTGTVTYTGARDGQLIMGLFEANPPSGPPVFFDAISRPAFPQTYRITDVTDGTWWVVALYDVGRDNPTIPGPEDVQVVAPLAVVVRGPGEHTVDLMVTDP